MKKQGRRATLAFLAATAVVLLAAAAAQGAAKPAWDLSSLATPTAFAPGDLAGHYTYEVRAADIGAASTDGTDITLTDTLPAGLQVASSPELKVRFVEAGDEHKVVDVGPECEEQTAGETTTVRCTVEQLPGDQETTTELEPLEELRLVIPVKVLATIPEGSTLTNEAKVEGGGAATVTTASHNPASSTPAEAGFSYFRAAATDEEGKPVTQAGGRPYQFTTSFALNTRPGQNPAPESPCAPVLCVPAGGDLKDVRVALPPGLVGNPNAIPKCSAQDFITLVGKPFGIFTYNHNLCPPGSAIGVITLRNVEGESLTNATPIYNLVPPPGVAAQFGFKFANIPFYIDGEVRSEPEYGIDALALNTSQAKRVSAASVTIWGTPAAASHDPLRGACLIPGAPEYHYSTGLCPAEVETVKPFFRMPTSCSAPTDILGSIDTWTTPGLFVSQDSPGPQLTGCESLRFEPTLAARPTTDVADSPSGLDAHLHLPQEEDPGRPGTPDLRDVTVKLPPGLVINPSGANGLEACSPAQVGLKSADGVTPPTFGPQPADCPQASRIGEMTVRTPLVDHPLPGDVYVAMPHQNPFDSLLAIYLVIDDPASGVIVKLAGKVSPDPATGQLTATFDQNPQTPFEDFELHFFGGANAALRTPQTCGPDETDSSLTPWSAPFSGPPVQSVDRYAITQAPGGGACATSVQALPNAPEFEAGSQAPIAGAYSPFTVRLSRPDGSQEFSSITVSPPPGLLARLAGVPYCPDAALQAAGEKSGHAEQADPSCPAASQVGTVVAGAGAGPSPYYTSGKVYLAGPYKGAPLSLATITPAVAGPYDLGDVVVRVALEVDPLTARVTAVADPLPRILEGVPLDVRQITLSLDRPQFSLNPTDCDPLAIEGSESSVLGASAPLSGHFQVGECGALKFKPKLKLALKGATKHAGHPALRAVLTYPKQGAYANIARAQVNLPHSVFIDQGNLNKTCTRPVLLEGKCTAKSIYGRAKAWTPLLEKPLEGPVYLVGGFGYKLPALVAELNGQIRVLLVGKVDSGPNKGIRNTFEAVPDAPVEKFELRMKGGPKYSLLENSEDLCKKPQKAIARFTAQDGKVLQWKPKIAISCAKKKHKKAGHHKAHGHGHGPGGSR